MSIYSKQDDPVLDLIAALSKLPSIGKKTATRLSYFILMQELPFAHSLTEAILRAKKLISLCNICYTFTETNPCKICLNTQRDFSRICIVEKPSDIHFIEQTQVYKGTYHVLHGILSPLDGIGPKDLKILELLERLKNNSESIQEIIFALNPSVEGETTSIYLAKQLKTNTVRLTKLAHGLPVGGMIEYTDRQTMGKALENRLEVQL